MTNPWVRPRTTSQETTPEPVRPSPRWAPGAEVAPVRALPTVAAPSGLWVVGAHGGAGSSTLAHLLGAGDAGRALPLGEGVSVLVACRFTRSGLEAAQRVAIQWVATVPTPRLVGLVVCADAPKAPPRQVRDLLKLVRGAFPTMWEIAWCEAWRGALPSTSSMTRPVERLRRDLISEGVLK